MINYIKKVLLIVIMTVLSTGVGFCEEATNSEAVAYTEIESCYKQFATVGENLFYKTLSAISANKYTIKEIHTKEGYILFKAGAKEFLATIVNVDDKNSLIKIAPTDNSYYFSPNIVNNIFNNIVANLQEAPVVYVEGK